ncbi:class I SAM-dependent methyltransferase [Epilithonimonas sp.]|uniref:class I SAM-dependent methyltransferase n=1 Tax=Epilithonimonas sp. TaxID=2894511 RepID=UPI00289B97A0|nr:class I SAM-dependent methyltransferase [Epilithonimonas sp.]
MYNINDKMFDGKENFEYFECKNCGTLQISKIPEDIGSFYPENYYSLASKIGLKDKLLFRLRDYIFYYNFPSFLVKKLKIKMSNLSLEAFLKLDPDKSSKILDVGCGEGKFLKSIFNLGFRNVLGIEPFALKEQESPFPIYKKNLTELNEKFDIITFNHVFEHVEDVNDTLKLCYNLLEKDGKIIIRIPVKDSFAYEFYKENWIQWDAPRHFQLLTKKAMTILTEQNNFKLRDYYCDSYKLQFTGSEKYKRNLSYQTPNSVFTKAELNEFTKRSIELNRQHKGDQVVAVLQKL